MADLLDELQRMAANINTAEIEPSAIQRWQRLFGFSYAQAKEQIQNYRDNIGRSRVSSDHWLMVKEEKEGEGHDRESYEYSLQHQQLSKKSLDFRCYKQTNSLDKATYIVKLEPPLETTLKIRDVTGTEPPTTSATGDTDTATFCVIDAATRQKLLEFIANFHPNFKPTIIRLSKSPKELCGISKAPFLGLDTDTTLPQHRAQTADFVPFPLQDQYPAWYFFYGNLAKSDELQRRLGLPEPPRYIPARVHGAQIKSWRGQYRALVDARADSVEEGSAYLVTSREDEDALRFYETEKYEVVRCSIEMGEGNVEPGLVFRFAGSEDELR